MNTGLSGDVHNYDADFYRYIGAGSLRSARLVLPPLCSLLSFRPAEVLDVGCGAGAWLAAWKELGTEVLGVDGSHVDRGSLLIEPGEFLAHDLQSPLALGRKFALVQCLEVAEHLPEPAAPVLVDSVCRHGDVVLFSAAPPGQGGEFHVNEQPYAYWRDLFAARGFGMYDPLRSKLLGESRILPWYRYNTFLYLREGAAPELRQRIAAHRVPPEAEPADVAPLAYRLRRRCIALLPVALATRIAVLKKSLFNLMEKS